ncbi:MAG: hypothetical protein FJX46_05630 [Alphaproteobacteria bacterium]|nr:hypothetical protein [Alphaproteobacteria bacterium]
MRGIAWILLPLFLAGCPWPQFGPNPPDPTPLPGVLGYGQARARLVDTTQDGTLADGRRYRLYLWDNGLAERRIGQGEVELARWEIVQASREYGFHLCLNWTVVASGDRRTCLFAHQLPEGVRWHRAEDRAEFALVRTYLRGRRLE